MKKLTLIVLMLLFSQPVFAGPPSWNVNSTNGVEPDISVSPTSKNYGDVLLGHYASRTFVVSNEGAATLDVSSITLIGTHAADYRITSSGGTFSLDPSESRNVVVTFAPLATGIRTAAVQFASTDPDENPLDVALSGEGVVPQIEVSPSSKDYGDVWLGSSTEQVFAVTNSGSALLTVSATTLDGANAGDFAVSNGGSFSLNPGVSRNVTVTFSPGSIGSKSAVLEIASDDPDNMTKSVSLAGNCELPPDISVSPTSKNYGDVVLGHYASRTFVVRNEGATTLDVTSITLIGIHAADYRITSSGGSFSLDPSESRNVVVTFAPLATGVRTATVQFASTDPDENPLDVALSGEGVVPQIEVSPTSKDYGDVSLGSYAEQVFTVTNSGSAPLAVSATTLSGTNAGEFSVTNGGSFSLNPGVSRNVTVTFTPGSNGSKSAALEIASDDPDNVTISVSLAGNGVLLPDISVTPASNDYGLVLLGQSDSQTFVVRNEGTADLEVSSVSVTGANPSEFSLISGGGSFTLTPGATRNVVADFVPISEGAKTGAITFASNDSDENPLNVTLFANGVAPDISVSPTTKNYGDVVLGHYASRTFVVRNDGTATLGVSLISIIGAHAADYRITSSGDSFSLAPSETRNVVVTFAPQDTGIRTATLRIFSTDPDENPLDVALSGTGNASEISVTPATFDFGGVLVGNTEDNTFVVSNIGTADLEVSSVGINGANPTEFSLISGGGSFTLTPSATRNLVVEFVPTSEGAKGATLTFASNDPDKNPLDVALSGEGVVPRIEVSPTSKDYGDVWLGSYAEHIYAVTNNGTAPLAVSSTTLDGANAGDFAVSNGGNFSLNPGVTRNVTVSFIPGSIGSKSAALEIVSDDPEHVTISVSLVGNGVLPPDISVAPASTDYGLVLLGQSESQTFVVRNGGNADLEVSSVSITGADPTEFSLISGGGSFTLPSSATQSVVVEFVPTSEGAKSAAITFHSNDPDENPLVIVVSGTCSREQDIDVTPVRKYFGRLNIGENETETFTVTNTGGLQLWVTEAKITGMNAEDFTIVTGGGRFSVPAGGSHEIVVKCAPLVPGPRDASLYIASYDPDESELYIGLSVNGYAPQINVEPDSVSFGAVAVNTASAEYGVAIKNIGNTDLVITNVEISGVNATEFTQTSGTMGFSLLPEAEEILNFTFTPQSAGLKECMVTIYSNDPLNPEVSVLFYGSGTEQDINVSPMTLDFGQVMVDASVTSKLKIENTGGADLVINTLNLTGSQSAAFTLVTLLPIIISPESYTEVEFQFTPTAATAYEAFLIVGSNDPDESSVVVIIRGAGSMTPVPKISAMPNPLTFADTYETGSNQQTLRINNTGSAPLNVSGVSFSGDDPNKFEFNGSVVFQVAPGDSHTVQLTFTPGAVGVYTSNLVISSDDPDETQYDVILQGQGIPVPVPDIYVSPNPKEFVAVRANKTSQGTIFIKNEGDSVLNVSGMALTGDNPEKFFINDSLVFQVAAGNSRAVQLTFNPGGVGVYTANLVISSDDPDENPYVVTLNGEGLPVPEPDICVSPNPTVFDDVPIHESGLVTLYVKNVGDSVLNVSGMSLSGNHPTKFEITGSVVFQVAPGDSQGVQVKFTPGVVGEYTANLDIGSDDPDENPYVVILQGSGIPALVPDIAATPNPVDFGTIHYNGSTATATLMLRNEGGAELAVGGMFIIGEDAINFALPGPAAAFIIAPEDSHLVTLTFSPDTVADFSADLLIVSNDLDENPLIVTLQGAATEVPVPHIEVLPDSIRFGNVSLDSTAQHTVFVNNTGTERLAINSLEISGLDADVFAYDCSTLEVDPGKGIAITIFFTPKTSAFCCAELVISSNDPDDATHTVRLEGSGYQTGVADVINGIPADFQLHQNYPNPFNPGTTISFAIPSCCRVTIEIYDTIGRRIRTLANAVYSSGNHEVSWNGRDDTNLQVSSGLYFIRMQTQDYIAIRQALFLK